MIRFHIVGLGSLGSTIAMEIAKRSLAISLNIELYLHDFDTVEERNTVAQVFDPSDIGSSKVDAVFNRVNQYKTVIAVKKPGKITKDNITDLGIGPESIIIDAVDNLPTRELLYTHCLGCATPVLHAGMSTKGMGYVQWSFMFNKYFIDTWSLSPKNISPAAKKALESKDDTVVPPCELNSLRTLIINTSMAAVNALFIFVGRDISEFVKASSASSDSSGLFTTWSTSVTGMNLIKELTSELDLEG